MQHPQTWLVALTAAVWAAMAPQAQAAKIKTVFVIAMENTNWTQPAGQAIQPIRGNPAAPWLNGLVDGTLTTQVLGQSIASQTAYAQAYHNVLATPTGQDAPVIHPSEPNYIWSEAGTNFQVFSDDEPYGVRGTHQATHRHLSHYLDCAGKTWRSYQEDIDLASNGQGKLTSAVLPRAQWTVPLKNVSGKSSAYTNVYNGSHQYNYAAKHNPMVFFDDTAGAGDASTANPQRLNYAPLAQLLADLKANTVASYNWITPNQFNDMHTELSGGFNHQGVGYTGAAAQIAQGDNFLSKLVPAIMASKAYQDGGLIVLWWDESEGVGANGYGTTIPEVVISKFVRPNRGGRPYASGVNLTHSDDLRTMQDIFGVHPKAGIDYLGDAAHAQGLGDLFVPGAVAAQPEAGASQVWADRADCAGLRRAAGS